MYPYVELLDGSAFRLGCYIPLQEEYLYAQLRPAETPHRQHQMQNGALKEGGQQLVALLTQT